MGILDFIYTGVIAHFLKKRLGGSGHHSAHDHHGHAHDHAHEHHGDHEDYDHEDSWREDEALAHGDHDLDDVIYNKYIHEDYDHDCEDCDHDDYDQDGYGEHDDYGEHDLDGWYGDEY